MVVLRWILLVSLILTCWTSEDDHDHHHNKEGSAHQVEESVEWLMESLGVQNHTVKAEHVDKLLQKLNFDKLCTTTDCKNCLNGKVLLGDFASSALDEDEFIRFIPALTYFLITKDFSAVCKNYTDLNDVTFNLFKSKYGGATLDEEKLEKILEDLNATTSSYLTNKTCFDVGDVIKGANVSETSLDKDDFEAVNVLVIFNVYNKRCIAEHHEEDHHDHDHEHEKLPERDHFIDELYKKFGANKNTMTRVGFEKLVKGLATATKSNLGVEEEHSHGCYSSKDLLEVFEKPNISEISRSHFQQICPALLQQLESGKCTEGNHDDHHGEKEEDNPDTWEPWIASLIAILIACIPSLLGAVTIPLQKSRVFPVILMFMISMGVSVLLGDALLHLLPHSFGLHQHEEGGHKGHGGEEHDSREEIFQKDSFLWKSTLAIVGIYLFFTFELFMHAKGHGHSHGDHDVAQEADEYPHQHVNGNGGAVIQNTNASGKMEFPMEQKPPEKPIGRCNMPIKDFRTVVWTVVVGDAVHNFVDGVAIGAVFSAEKFPTGLNGGISTTIAIILHELPHELGDFAILLQSGLSFSQALCMNFFSSLTSLIGGIIGVLLGTQWKAGPWIFAITGGIFIYIAIANMLPEIFHNKLLKQRRKTAIIVSMSGMFLGFLIMFLIAAFEEEIVV